MDSSVADLKHAFSTTSTVELSALNLCNSLTQVWWFNGDDDDDDDCDCVDEDDDGGDYYDYCDDDDDENDHPQFIRNDVHASSKTVAVRRLPTNNPIWRDSIGRAH